MTVVNSEAAAKLNHGSRAWSSPRQLLADAAREWSLPTQVVAGISILPFIVILAGVCAGLIGKDAYKWFTGEDRFAENLQVFAFAFSCLLSLWMAHRLHNAGRNLIAVAYVCVGAGLFLVAGEEIAWGQRIFGWETPEALEAINKQEETTFHNIISVDLVFKWAKILAGACGTFLPLIVLYWDRLAPQRHTLSLLIPHYTLVPFFVFPFVWGLYRELVPEPREHQFAVAEFAEVVELNLALGILLFFLFQWRREQNNRRDRV